MLKRPNSEKWEQNFEVSSGMRMHHDPIFHFYETFVDMRLIAGAGV